MRSKAHVGGLALGGGMLLHVACRRLRGRQSPDAAVQNVADSGQKVHFKISMTFSSVPSDTVHLFTLDFGLDNDNSAYI